MSALIEVDSVFTRFGTQEVHKGVSFSIESGKVVALIGASGTGKSVLLREIIHLQPPTSGSIRLFSEDVWKAPRSRLNALRKRFGVLFQNGALFSSLTVGENVALPLVEHGGFSTSLTRKVVQLRLALSGLSPDVARKKPSELSGGMRKRVALARALALEPELLFLDEPTSGLDPIGARAFDALLSTLAGSLGLTVLMVTHDLDSLQVVDRVIALGEGQVIADGPLNQVKKSDHPWLTRYFNSRAGGN